MFVMELLGRARKVKATGAGLEECARTRRGQTRSEAASHATTSSDSNGSQD